MAHIQDLRSPTPQPRRITGVNWIGVWTLYAKEVRRFLKVINQTVSAPIVTTLMFLAVFTLALDRRSAADELGVAAGDLVVLSAGDDQPNAGVSTPISLRPTQR